MAARTYLYPLRHIVGAPSTALFMQSGIYAFSLFIVAYPVIRRAAVGAYNDIVALFEALFADYAF